MSFVILVLVWLSGYATARLVDLMKEYFDDERQADDDRRYR